MYEEQLKDLEGDIESWVSQGSKINPSFVNFIDDLYVIASKLYMLVHKNDDN